MAQVQKVKLGARPKSFPKLIEIPMLDGTTGCVQVIFKYRTRKEFAQLNDELQANARAAATAEAAKIEQGGEAPKLLSQEDLLSYDIGARADFVMAAVEGWNLDEKFDRGAVEQLADELPAAISAIIDGYRVAINEGRLGN